MINWKRVQTRLRDLGFDPGPVDGIRGPKTDAAVVAFKTSIGLRARPFVGPLTLAALFDILPAAKDRSGDLPWMKAAQEVRGLHEARNRSKLVDWFAPSVSWLDPREVPWCGAFVLTCHRMADPRGAFPENPLGARNWGKFGISCNPVFGATLTFWRGSRSGWKGHVGFYSAEDSTHYHVLGGNQGNAVTVTRIAKSRLLDARWPAGKAITGKSIHVTPGGVPVTTNEA